MSSAQFDLITIGGGLAASSLAIAMARQGARVLILEKEKQFRDRVRGEGLLPWGVAEAKELGIAGGLLKSCAKELPWIEMGFGPRNLVETTPQKVPSLSFFHPAMQEALLAEAERVGAQVRRGVTAQAVEAGANRAAVVARNAKEERIAARLVVAADGRGSAVRKWAGFQTQKNVQPFQFAGVLLTGVATRDDLGTFIFNSEMGTVVGIIPQPQERCRVYLGYPTSNGMVLQGGEKLTSFFAEARKVAPIFAETFALAESVGPLATFEAGESWVEHPYRDGIALLGDAAATNDPTFGQGMATALRDARVLRDALLANSDWDRAGHQYAREHDSYFQNTLKVCGWLRKLFQEQSPEAQEIRQKAMPRIAEDLTRVPDHLFGGPELPSDDSVRARFFGED